MRLVLAGTPAVALPALDALAGSRHELIAVLTRPDAAAGRGRHATRSPVAAWADRHGVRVLQPTTPADPAFLTELAGLAPDCCPVVAYGCLLPDAALAVPRHGWVNLHFSVLPAWRGAAPVQRALIAGDEITGATTFRIDRGLDTGPVFGVLTEPVRERDTAGELLARLADAGAGLLLATMDGIEAGTLQSRPQPDQGVSHAPKVRVAEARLDWSAPALRLDRLARGCTPDPGAWTTWRGDRLGVAEMHRRPAAAPDGAVAAAVPGTLLVGRREVLVATGDEPVELVTVQPAGRRPMPAADWARGARPAPGERLQ